MNDLKFAEYISRRKWDELSRDEQRAVARILTSTDRGVIEACLEHFQKPVRLDQTTSARQWLLSE